MANINDPAPHKDSHLLSNPPTSTVSTPMKVATNPTTQTSPVMVNRDIKTEKKRDHEAHKDIEELDEDKYSSEYEHSYEHHKEIEKENKRLKRKLNKYKEFKEEYKKEKEMHNYGEHAPVNVFTSQPSYPVNGSLNGLGNGGVIEGLLFGTLLGRGGFGGLGGYGGYGGYGGIGYGAASPAVQELTTIEALRDLGEVKKDIAVGVCDVNATIANAENALSNQITQATISNMQGDFAIQQSLTNGFNSVQTQACANTNSIISAVVNESEKTRALVSAIESANTTRIINAQATELAELRSEGRRRDGETSIRIDMINNQNQLQQQQQAQAGLLNGIYHTLADVNQLAKATNNQILVGTGNAGGAQTSTPTNVNA